MNDLRQALTRRVVWPACAVLGLLAALLAPGAGQAAPSAFDHFTTGYELLGQHAQVACEACHVGGIFKGTPHDCFACHAAGSRIGASAKPTNHIVSSNDCAQCHTPFGWKPVAQFDHLNVLGTCSSCHNNVQAIGKGPTHMATTLECGACHKVLQPFTASIIIPPNHIPYAPTAACGACHKVADFSVIPSLTDTHANAPSTTTNCSQCHGSTAAFYAIAANGFKIVGIPSGHITANADSACESCHVGANSSIKMLPVLDGANFKNSAMSHAGLTTCVGCHATGVGGFAGITQLVVMPPVSPAGPNTHIPSVTACESCHVAPSGLVPGNAPTLTLGSTGFLTPVPTTAQIHANITSSNCSGCHEGGNVWADMGKYPLMPGVLGVSTTQYMGFQARPLTAASGFSIADPAHPTMGDCSRCHTRTDYFEGTIKPSNHIPYLTSASCESCHTDPGHDYSKLPSLTNIHLYAQSTTTNCSQCHGSAAASFAIPAASFSIVGIPAKHVTSNPDSVCESCHVGAISSIKTLPVVDGAKFSGSAMSHVGVTDCGGCHGPATTGFMGVAQLVIMPPTSPAGPNAHIPSTTACSDCHAAPSGLVPASAASLAIGATGFLTLQLPTTVQIHNGITSNCSSCHEGGNSWADMNKYPLAPAALSGNATTQYMGFQARPLTAASGFSIADPAHPAMGDCSICHTRTDYFEGTVKPANHIPYAAAATCASCHKNPNFAVSPSLTDTHANAQSTTTNCIQCHGSAAASFAIPAASFSIVAIPAKHITANADSACETCHVGATSSIATLPVLNGATFKSSAMSHAGLTTCVECHATGLGGFAGIAQLAVMPATSPMGANAHIPSVTTCESCHVAPGSAVPASAPSLAIGTTGFLTLHLPTTAEIHKGIISNCSSCHEGNYVWADMGQYPLAPGALTGNSSSQYKGFQARPLAAAAGYSILDAAHPKTGDCATCHASTDYFDGLVKPANHIPYAAAAACSACHKNTDYSVWPSLTDTHANAQSTTTNCIQCHGSTAATFAIPAANNFAILGIPAKHISSNADAPCETCHVGAGSSIAALPVVNGAKFTNSAMSHSGLATCVACHATGAGGFVGITRLVVMPASSPMGANAHIPSVTTCETCHAAPAGLIPANAPSLVLGATAFLTPIPSTGQIHAGLTSGCSSCHENGNVWLDMGKYPIAPTALTGNAASLYTGFQLRPLAAAGTFSVADAAHPVTGDCVNCHGTDFTSFNGQAEPSNHIPTTTNTCATCHTTAGNYAVWSGNLTTLHANVPTTCSTCHADGKGPFAGPTGFTIVRMSTRGVHIPITNAGVPVECSGCHKSVLAFTGTIMSHMAIGDTGSASGVQTGNACDACHELGASSQFYNTPIRFHRDSPNHYICGAPGTPTAPNVTICPTKGGSDCLVGCHEHVGNIPAQFKSVRPKTPRKQIQSAQSQPAAPVLRTAILRAARGANTPRLAAGLPMPGTALALVGGKVDHAVLVGRSCQSCHNGTLAHGKPAGHPLSGNDCDRCHTTSAWKPAAFDHSAVMAGTCATCHNALTAPGKPSAHVATTLSCDSCHYVLGWKPVKPLRAQPPTAPHTIAPRSTTVPRARASGTAAPL